MLKFRSRAFRWCMTHKADVIDDVTIQTTLFAFFQWFFGLPPTQMSTYDQKFGMKMIARTWRIFWNINWKKCWFSTKKFSKLPLCMSLFFGKITSKMRIRLIQSVNFITMFSDSNRPFLSEIKHFKVEIVFFYWNRPIFHRKWPILSWALNLIGIFDPFMNL